MRSSRTPPPCSSRRGGTRRYVTAFGFTLEEIYAHGAEAIESRLRAAGLNPQTLRVGLPFEVPPEDRARRGLAMLRAGYLGEPNGPVEPDAEITGLLFDGLRRQIDTSLAPGARILWEFDDAEPWHLTVENGTATTGPGRVENPDLTFRGRFQDWVDVSAGRADPVRAVLTRKIRPSGKLRMLVRVPKLFGVAPAALLADSHARLTTFMRLGSTIGPMSNENPSGSHHKAPGFAGRLTRRARDYTRLDASEMILPGSPCRPERISRGNRSLGRT